MASSNKITVNYLVFDDDNEAENQYSKNIKISGYVCNPIFINPTDFYNPDENNFNKSDFIKTIQDKTLGVNINLIVCDWNIIAKNESFQGIVGWDIVQHVIEAKEKLISKPFLIYSSDIRNASSYILSRIADDVCNKEDLDLDLSLPKFIQNILQLRIKFWKRDRTHFNEIITLLKNSNTISNIVLDTIAKHEDNFIINTGNEYFDGNKIHDLIKDHNNIKGLKFIREIIELSIAHYSELNA